MKRALGLLLVLSVVLSICGGALAEENPYAQHVSLTVSSFAYTDKFDDEFYDYWSEKYNVDVKQNQITFNDWDEKTRMWIYSGTMPDITLWNFDTKTNYSEYLDFIDQGLIKALPDNWEATYPNLARAIEATGFKDDICIDGKTYMVPHPMLCNLAPTDVNYWHASIIYRKDWAEEFGIDVSDYLFTLDELEEYVAKSKEKYGAIAMSSSPTLLATLFMPMKNPYYDTFHKDENGKYVWGPAEESTLEGIKLMKKYYDNGTIDKEYFVGDASVHYGKWDSGKVCAIYSDCSVANLAYREQKLQTQYPEINTEQCVGAALLLSDDGEWYGKSTANYFGATLFSPDITDAQLDRFLRIADDMCTEEGQFMACMGIENVHWKRNEDGSLESLLPKDEFGAPVDILMYLPSSMWLGTIGIQLDDFAFVNPGYSQTVRDNVSTLYKIRAERDIGPNVSHFDPEYDFHAGPAKNNYVCDVVGKINELVVSNDVDIDAEWWAWVDSMQGMVQPVLDELNADYAE